MGQVEELPDNFDETLNLNDASNVQQQQEEEPRRKQADSLPPSGVSVDMNKNKVDIEHDISSLPPSDEVPFPINEERLKEIQGDPAAPRMPPTMASVKSNTAEDIADMMNKSPLFMTDIDKAKDESAYRSGKKMYRWNGAH